MDIISYLLGKKAGGGGGSPIIPPEAGVLESIVVGSLPDKTTYIEGEPLDLTGLVILGNFSNGYQYDVTSGCTFICNDPVTYYDTKITAKYVIVDTEKTVDIPITVNGVPVQAPASTTLLAHFDGNLINEVTGAAASSGTYTQREGKFSYGQGAAFTYPTTINIRGGSHTIEYWLKLNQNHANDYPSSYVFINSSSNYALWGGGTPTNGILLNSGMRSNYTTDYLPTNVDYAKWHHIAVVFDGGNYRIYFDGRLNTHGQVNQSYTNAFNAFRMTYCPYSDVYDEVMICDEAKYVADFEPPHAAYYLAGGE